MTSLSSNITAVTRRALLTSPSHPLQKKFIEVAMEEAGVVAQEAHDKAVEVLGGVQSGGNPVYPTRLGVAWWRHGDGSHHGAQVDRP